jgi:hypothetical protein
LRKFETEHEDRAVLWNEREAVHIKKKTGRRKVVDGEALDENEDTDKPSGLEFNVDAGRPSDDIILVEGEGESVHSDELQSAHGGVIVTEQSQSAIAAWNFHFTLLRQYRADQGHCAVPRDFICNDGFKLGIWVTNQRKRQSRGALLATRKERLDSIGFSWDMHGDQWRRWFDLLKRFHADRGHTVVPTTYCTEEGSRLGVWVNNQRRKYAKVTSMQNVFVAYIRLEN